MDGISSVRQAALEGMKETIRNHAGPLRWPRFGCGPLWEEGTGVKPHPPRPTGRGGITATAAIRQDHCGTCRRWTFAPFPRWARATLPWPRTPSDQRGPATAGRS